jgi:hypothetical protein
MAHDDDDDEPSAQSARIVVGVIIILVALFAIILAFVTQTNLVRAMEFGAALVEFILGIVICVL